MGRARLEAGAGRRILRFELKFLGLGQNLRFLLEIRRFVSQIRRFRLKILRFGSQIHRSGSEILRFGAAIW